MVVGDTVGHGVGKNGVKTAGRLTHRPNPLGHLRRMVRRHGRHGVLLGHEGARNELRGLRALLLGRRKDKHAMAFR